MKKIYLLLLGIFVLLLGIFSAIMFLISDSYIFFVFIIAFPIIAVFIVVFAFLPLRNQRNKQSKDAPYKKNNNIP